MYGAVNIILTPGFSICHRPRPITYIIEKKGELKVCCPYMIFDPNILVIRVACQLEILENVTDWHCVLF